MASLLEVCQAITDTITANTDLTRGYAYVPDDPNPPAFIVTLQAAAVQAFKLGSYDLPMRVTIITGTQSDRAGQEQLMGYVDFESSASVWRALYSHRDLGFGDDGGVDCAVKQYEPLGIITLGSTNYYAGAFDLMVLVSPTRGA